MFPAKIKVRLKVPDVILLVSMQFAKLPKLTLFDVIVTLRYNTVHVFISLSFCWYV